MAITKAFTDAVASGDIRGMRIMMKDSLLVDLTFRDFAEMSRLAAKVPGLYDVHDGRSFVEDSSAWDDDYMNRLMVQVVGNFSHERLDHLKEVVRHLRPVPEHSLASAQKPHCEVECGSSGTGGKHRGPVDYEAQKAEDAQSGRIVKIVGGATAGAAVGGAGAAILGATAGTVIACAAAGAAAGGVIAASLTRGERDDE